VGNVDNAVAVAVGDVGIVGVDVAAVIGEGVGVPGMGVVDGAVGAAAVGNVECIRIAVDGTWGWWGVSNVENAGSNVVKVEQVC